MKPSLYKYRKLQNLAAAQPQGVDLDLGKQLSLSIGKAPLNEVRKMSLYSRGSQRKTQLPSPKQAEAGDAKVAEENL